MKDRQLVRQIDRQIERRIDRKIDLKTYRQIDRQIDRSIDRQIDRQIVRQIDRLDETRLYQIRLDQIRWIDRKKKIGRKKDRKRYLYIYTYLNMKHSVHINEP